MSKNCLSKKQKKYYKKRIISKLEEIGLEDAIKMQPTSKTKNINYYDQKENKMKVAKQPIFVASNVFRNITKKLLSLSVTEVEVFLNSEIKPKKEREQAPEEEATDVKEV